MQASGSQAFLQVFDRDPIYDLIFDDASPASLLCVSRTCRMAYFAVQDYMRRTFDIEKHLGKYFDDPAGFRELQARTQTVISGSSALQFMDRTVFPDSDLDVYATVEHMREVCAWIVDQGSKGYAYRPRETQYEKLEDELLSYAAQRDGYDFLAIDQSGSLHDYRHLNLAGVVNFHSTNHSNDIVPLKVQVIVAVTTPMDSILCFHSTVVMNAITHQAAYSFFPKATFEDRIGLVCAVRGTQLEKAIEKYEDRGWDMQRNMKWTDRRASQLDYGKRWVADGYSWILPLKPISPSKATKMSHSHQSFDASADSQLPLDPFRLNGFDFVSNLKDGLPEIRYATVDPRIFKYCYTANIAFTSKLLRLLRTIWGLGERVKVHAYWDFVLPALTNMCMESCGCVAGSHADFLSMRLGSSQCPASDPIRAFMIDLVLAASNFDV